ncbi:hypothetical protein SAMN05216464_103278 [Mucilaginibacter pineti]|uniref:Uncharacterized protein n=1 Tax=Mucilaginibacter pineti TaxID=1391627 RepID=A0A1G6ZAF1_9SPHI|nr:hypothetical protein [Mucilaginibacter pineti]SDD99608.1 hypothetical protein SAMN05216464_103278 [Mucilaginibacter pineti]
MDRRQKIMRLIIDALTQNKELVYDYIGTTTLMDPNVITIDFVVKTKSTSGKLNIWGMIDVSLMLKAQYDSKSELLNHPEIQQQINVHLKDLAKDINRLL